MANIQILPQDFELSKSGATTITLGTKDKYVLEDIDVVVKPHIGSFNNQASNNITYTEDTSAATVIPSGGYLYLNQGWFENTKISLGHLIPDDVEYTNAGVLEILSGYEAYDTNGQKLIGTMATVDPKFDGGGLSVTPSVIGLNKPTVTVSSSGTFKTSTDYGVTLTKPSGTDGTNYLTIDGKASVTKGSVKASASARRGAVLYNGVYKGYLDKADNTQILEEANTSKESTASEIDATITDSFKTLYIPIVSVTGTGGGLSKASSGNSVSITGTNPTVTLSYDGKFTDTTGASYGVTTTEPTTGEDGTDFLKVGVGGTSVDQTFTATATIKVDRAVVTNDGLKQGAINIADGAKLLAAGSDTFTHSGTLNVTASLSNDKAYYIPIIKSMPVKGGDMTKASSRLEITGKNPTVTISNSGKFTDVGSGGVGASYGVTTTAPTTGTDGTDFLKITIDGTSNTQIFTGSSKIYVNRAAVTHDGAAAGAIKWANGSSILAGVTNEAFSATTDTDTQKSVTATVTGGTSYYIPIVNLTNKGTGGSVTASATANVDIVKPKVDYTPTGTVTTNLDSLGVSHRPFEGEEDGSGYYSLVITPTATSDGSVSGSVSGTWNRTAVKSNGTYQGAVNLSTTTQFLAAGSGTITSADTNTSIGVDFTSVTDEDKNWYFKRAKVSSNGGGLEDAELGITGDAPTVTPNINFLSRTNSTNGSAITLSAYGITETAPTTGNWVVFDPTGTSTNATFTGSVTAARSLLTISVSKGLTGATDSIVERATKTYTNTRRFAATVGAGTNRYIPVRAVTAEVSSHSVTNPTVNYSESAGYYISGVKQNSVPSGILLAQTSEPSDFATKKYIKIDPLAGGVTLGSSSTTAKGSILAGITAGGSATTTESTQKIGVTTGTTKSCYIKVYDGGYTVS